MKNKLLRLIRKRDVVYTQGYWDIVVTDDGSHTLYHKELDETYHSLHGAFAESLYVFIQQGLFYCSKTNLNRKHPLNILEIGWGTGLNTLLTMEKASVYNLKINYIALEPHPLPIDLVAKLNYQKYVSSQAYDYFLWTHKMKEKTSYQLNPYFRFQKIYSKLTDLSDKGIQILLDETNGFSLVYFDAFGMSKQKEPWEENNFFCLKNIMAKNAVLVTYASNRLLKERLRNQGFSLDILSGHPPKKEMIRATNTISN